MHTDRMCRGVRGGFDETRLDPASCAVLEAKVEALRDCACACHRTRNVSGRGSGPLDDRMGDPARYSSCIHGMP